MPRNEDADDCQIWLTFIFQKAQSDPEHLPGTSIEILSWNLIHTSWNLEKSIKRLYVTTLCKHVPGVVVFRPWRHVPGQQRLQRPDRRRFLADVLHHPPYIWTPSNRLRIAARQITRVSGSQQSTNEHANAAHIPFTSDWLSAIRRWETTSFYWQPQIAFPPKHSETSRLSSVLVFNKRYCGGKDLAVFVFAIWDKGVQLLNSFTVKIKRPFLWSHTTEGIWENTSWF